MVSEKKRKITEAYKRVTENTFLCIGQQQEICQHWAALWFARAIKRLCKQ